MRNVDGIVKIKSSLRRKCIEIRTQTSKMEERRENERVEENWQCMASRRAFVAIDKHIHIYTTQTDRQAYAKAWQNLWLSTLKMLRRFFFSCVKIADSDSRSICNPHLSISLTWHGFPLAMPYHAHTHTRIQHLLYVYFDVLSLSWPCIYCDGWWCARREAAALAHHARVTSYRAILFFSFFVPLTTSSSSSMLVRWCQLMLHLV